MPWYTLTRDLLIQERKKVPGCVTVHTDTGSCDRGEEEDTMMCHGTH